MNHFGVTLSIDVPDNWAMEDVEKHLNEKLSDITIWEL
jgi:hypothetical protein